MKHRDPRQEALEQWEEWHRLQTQIKELENLVAEGDESLEQHQARLIELRAEEEAARKMFERTIERLR